MPFKRNAEWAWKMKCSLQWWNPWGRGWQPSKNGAPDWIFLSSEVEWMGKNSWWVSGWREVLAPKSQGATTTCHQQCHSSRTPAERCWFHMWSFSKHSISQLPTLRSPGICLLKPVHVIHVARVLSLAGLHSRIMWTPRHEQCNFSYAASSNIQHLQTSVLRADWSHCP